MFDRVGRPLDPWRSLRTLLAAGLTAIGGLGVAVVVAVVWVAWAVWSWWLGGSGGPGFDDLAMVPDDLVEVEVDVDAPGPDRFDTEPLEIPGVPPEPEPPPPLELSRSRVEPFPLEEPPRAEILIAVLGTRGGSDAEVADVLFAGEGSSFGALASEGTLSGGELWGSGSTGTSTVRSGLGSSGPEPHHTTRVALEVDGFDGATAVLRRNSRALTNCAVAGGSQRVTVELTVEGGVVVAAEALGDEGQVASCLVRRFRRVRFDPDQNGRVLVTVKLTGT